MAMQVWELYRSFSSKSRLAVIEAITDSPLRYSEILTKTGMNTTDLSRQLQRLTKDSIVEKTSQDKYQLTQFGVLAAISIPIFRFLGDNQELLNTRDLSMIPMSLLNDIDSLQNSMLVDSVYESIKLQTKLIPTIQKWFWIMTDDFSPEWVEVTHKLVDEGVRVKMLVNQEILTVIRNEAPVELVDKLEIRTLDKIQLVIGYSDKHSMLCFSSKEGKPDRNHYLFGDDSDFRHWTYHCFLHFWGLADPVQ